MATKHMAISLLLTQHFLSVVFLYNWIWWRKQTHQRNRTCSCHVHCFSCFSWWRSTQRDSWLGGPTVVISQSHRLVSQERLSQSRHLASGGSNFYSWCVTPHSSPSRGYWQCLTIFNILNIFIIINKKQCTGQLQVRSPRGVCFVCHFLFFVGPWCKNM